MPETTNEEEKEIFLAEKILLDEKAEKNESNEETLTTNGEDSLAGKTLLEEKIEEKKVEGEVVISDTKEEQEVKDSLRNNCESGIDAAFSE